jgi:hypothetical protein
MPYYEFDKNDILYNTIKAHPFCEFVLYSGSVYLNNQSSSLHNIPNGHVSLNELNVNRDPSLHTYDSQLESGTKHLAYPFITKDGSLDAFSTVSTTNFRFGGYGDELTSSYPLTSTLGRFYVATGSISKNRNRIYSLRTAIDYNKRLSTKFDFEENHYETIPIGLISIPSIFYGSSLQKGSVKVKFYVTGSLIAEAHDKYKNGEMIQTTSPSGMETGNCVGLVLYKEGMILMTDQHQLHSSSEGDNYNTCEIKTDGTGMSAPDRSFNWTYWGEMGLHSSERTYGSQLGSNYCQDDWSDVGEIKSSSYALEFNGTTRTPVMTMFSHAPKGELNFSSNPTFKPKPTLTGSQEHIPVTGAMEYIEPHRTIAKNTISSSLDTTRRLTKNKHLSAILKFMMKIMNVSPLQKLQSLLKNWRKEGILLN